MAGSLVADVAVRVVAVVKVIFVFFSSILSAENAIAIVIVFVVAVAEALNNHAVAFGTAFKLTTPTCTNK